MRVRAPAQRLRRSLMILGLIALAFMVLGTMLTYSRYRRDLSDARDRLARGRPSRRDVLWSDRIQRGRQREDRSQYTAARIPNARFATQEFGGHFVYVRDAVLGEIRAFIDQYGRTP